MSDRELNRVPPPPIRGNGARVADLPPPETRRWVARRKAQIVAAVRAGVLSLEDACTCFSNRAGRVKSLTSRSRRGARASLRGRHGTAT
jgi:Protein of unknown function (DUF1153)